MSIIHIGTAVTLAVEPHAGSENNDVAYIWLNGYTRKMVFDSTSVKVTDTVNHPYYLRHDDFSGSGVWIEDVGADQNAAWSLNSIATGIIRSLNWDADAGSEIDMDAGTIKLGGSSSPKFSVTADGILTATEANISGAITAATIDIGGATPTSFHVDVNGNVWAGAAAYNIATNPFAVSNAGLLRAVSGVLGGWTLGVSELTGTSSILKAAGVLSLGTGTDAYATVNRIYIDGPNNKMSVGATFKVENGALTSTSGAIGGFTINGTNGLYAGAGATRVQIQPGVGIWTGATAQAEALNYLDVDGSGWLAGGSITWNTSGGISLNVPENTGGNEGVTSGIIFKNDRRWLYDFNPAENVGGITPSGSNTFLGIECGNTSMGATATTVSNSSYNVGIGYQSLISVEKGSSNIGIGYQALYADTDGINNIGIGYCSLLSLTYASENIAIGSNALTTLTSGDYNIAIGNNALKSCLNSSHNIAIGIDALFDNTGSNNVAIGSLALSNNVGGGNNVALGLYAGDNYASYNASVLIGSGSDVHATGETNQIVIGFNATGNGSNTITLGNDSITDLFTYANINLADNAWIGLGAAKGRIKFVDDTVDEVNFLDCNVGIGVTPSEKLSVQGNIEILANSLNINMDLVTGGWTRGLNFYDNATILGTFGALGNGDANTLSYLFVGTAYTNTWMAWLPNGNVGIGTTAPNQLLTVENSISLKEIAAANADTAAYGQIWVKTATPNELYFTDDAGTDTQISSHPLDAPPELYINGPGLDWMGKRVQKYLGIIFWQTLDGVITGETFDAYNARRKDEEDHVDLVKLDWDTVQLAKLRAEKLKEIIETEVAADDAFEIVEITEEIQAKTKADGYEYVLNEGGKVEIKAKFKPVMTKRGTNKFEKKLKSGISFDSETGKFTFIRQMPEAEVNKLNLKIPGMPKWIKDWKDKQKTI